MNSKTASKNKKTITKDLKLPSNLKPGEMITKLLKKPLSKKAVSILGLV